MNLVNWPVIKNPMNWLIVVLMLTIVMVGADIVSQYLQSKKEA